MFGFLLGARHRSAQKFLLVIPLWSTVALGHARDPIDERAVARAIAKLNAMGCDLRLTPNQKFAARPNARRGVVHFGTTELRLMNEVLRPVTGRIKAYVLGLDEKQIVRLARALAPNPVIQDKQLEYDSRKFSRDVDAAYDGRLWWGPETFLRASFTRNNRRVIERLTLAVTVLHQYHRSLRSSFRDVLDSGGDVLDCHSYSHRDLGEILEFAELTVLHAASLLTASPVDGLTVDEVFARAMAPHKRHQSLVNRLALRAPPGLVPELGQTFYLADLLTVVHGELKFGPKLTDLIDRRHVNLQTRGTKAFESGLGCPLGHRLRGVPGTGVQDTLDAVIHIYRALREVSFFTRGSSAEVESSGGPGLINQSAWPE